MYNVHAIGDSHVLHMGGLFFTYHIHDAEMQGATAHNLIEDFSSTKSKKRLNLVLSWLDPTKDHVLMCFGEVDCRLHIRSDEMVKATVERYTQAIKSVVNRGFKVTVHEVIGAVPQDNTWRQPDYPDAKTRGHWVLEFNHLLSEWCEANGVGFLRLNLMDDDGALYAIATDDDVHLNDIALPKYRAWAESQGGEVKNVVWCLSAMEHFGRVSAEALGWPLIIDGPVGDVDNVFIVGMYDPPYYAHTLRMTQPAKNKIIQWCGADTTFVDPRYIPDATHFSSDESYRRALLDNGGPDAPVVLLPCNARFEKPLPMPKIPTVGVYLGSNPLKYGAEWVTALAKILPDVPFLTYEFGTYEDPSEAYAQTTVQVQLGFTNGGCSLREAMEAGRHAISYGMEYEGVIQFRPTDFMGLVKQVKKALAMKEPDAELAARWRDLNDPKHFVAAIEGACR
jgi:hypothetical protein